MTSKAMEFSIGLIVMDEEDLVLFFAKSHFDTMQLSLQPF